MCGASGLIDHGRSPQIERLRFHQPPVRCLLSFSFQCFSSLVHRWNEFTTEACYQLVVNSIGTWNEFATEDDVLQCTMSEQIGDGIWVGRTMGKRKAVDETLRPWIWRSFSCDGTIFFFKKTNEKGLKSFSFNKKSCYKFCSIKNHVISFSFNKKRKLMKSKKKLHF